MFGPVYAVHLFPMEACENATSRRIATTFRFRPQTVNIVCYVTPVLVLLPALVITSIWPVYYERSSERPSF